MERTSLRIEVTGRVQGVGFRAFVRRIAEAFDINGWVRNRSDGSVEIVASGDQDHLRAFIEQVEIGPRAATVEHVHIRDHDVDAEHGPEFHIRM